MTWAHRQAPRGIIEPGLRHHPHYPSADQATTAARDGHDLTGSRYTRIVSKWRESLGKN